jgi:hypothetical protein
MIFIWSQGRIFDKAVTLRLAIAVEISQVTRYWHPMRPLSGFAVWKNLRARIAQSGATMRAGCAYSSGLVRAMNVNGYRSSGAALYCARIRQRWWAQPLPIAVPCGLVAAEPCAWVGARRVAR